MDEKLDRVNKDGKVIGQITRGEAYKKGYLHPAVNLILVDLRARIYLQKRSAYKSAFPLYWDISVSEHVASGENFEQAAKRGLFEELSVKSSVKLIRSKHVQMSKYKRNGELILENELVELYGIVYDGKIAIDRSEIESGHFFSVNELRKFNEENFTPWGLDEINFILKNSQLLQF